MLRGKSFLMDFEFLIFRPYMDFFHVLIWIRPKNPYPAVYRTAPLILIEKIGI